MGKKRVGYSDFFCWNCGKRIEKGAEICPNCGVKYYGKNKYGSKTALGAGGIGWSDQTGHPSFKKYFKKKCAVVFTWLIGLSILIPAILLLIGDIGLDSEGITVIKVVVGILWFIGLLFLYPGRNKPDWEGVVEDKKVVQKTRIRKDSEKRKYKESYRDFIVSIRKQDGSLYELKKEDDSTQYEYYRLGDYVRYHGNKHLRCFEKYDKSLDETISCVSCGSQRDIRDNFCGRCGSVLLKAASVEVGTDNE